MCKSYAATVCTGNHKPLCYAKGCHNNSRFSHRFCRAIRASVQPGYMCFVTCMATAAAVGARLVPSQGCRKGPCRDLASEAIKAALCLETASAISPKAMASAGRATGSRHMSCGLQIVTGCNTSIDSHIKPCIRLQAAVARVQCTSISVLHAVQLACCNNDSTSLTFLLYRKGPEAM